MNLVKNVGVGLCLCILAMLCSSSRVVPQAELTNSSIAVAPPVQPKAKKQQKTTGKFRLFSKKNRLKKQKEGDPKYNIFGPLSAAAIGAMLAVSVISAFVANPVLSILSLGFMITAFILGLLNVLKAEKKAWGWVGVIAGGLMIATLLGSLIFCTLAPNCTFFLF